MDFSQILKQLRLERGWSQQDVADKIGLNKMTVSQYENGQRRPSFNRIKKIAEVFHVDINYLLGFSTESLHPVSLSEIQMIEAYRHAGAETQAAVRAVLHMED